MATKKKSTKKQGRPTIYSFAKSEKICKLHADGKTLTECCKIVGIGRTTLYEWISKHDDFSERLARASILFCDSVADDAISIADTPEQGEIVDEVRNPNGEGYIEKIRRHDMTDHRRLRVETRLKLLAKWSPDKYGDRKKVALTGENGGAVKIESSVDLTNSQKSVLDKVLDDEY